MRRRSAIRIGRGRRKNGSSRTSLFEQVSTRDAGEASPTRAHLREPKTDIAPVMPVSRSQYQASGDEACDSLVAAGGPILSIRARSTGRMPGTRSIQWRAPTASMEHPAVAASTRSCRSPKATVSAPKRFAARSMFAQLGGPSISLNHRGFTPAPGARMMPQTFLAARPPSETPRYAGPRSSRHRGVPPRKATRP